MLRFRNSDAISSLCLLILVGSQTYQSAVFIFVFLFFLKVKVLI